ncbi:MAG: NAD(P)-binding domain-containing protein [Gammaproteobacteria bacterium]
MKILIADAFPAARQAALSADGHRLTFAPTLEGDALRRALGDNDALVVRSTRVDAAALDAGGALKLVIRAGAGTNTIDKAHAAQNGVRVCNVPGANSAAVAELVMGMIIAIDRNIPANVTDLRAGKWRKKQYAKARGLHGQCIGILGLGAIGLAVALRARAFGMRVCALAKAGRDAHARQAIAECEIAECESREQLLGQSDIVSLHLPANPRTEKMVDDAFLAHMKDGAMLLNTARGELLDEAALLRAFERKGIRAGLDVYQNEPASGEAEFASPLARHPNVCGTHHIGASTEQAQDAVADGVARIITAFARGELLHCVNQSL